MSGIIIDDKETAYRYNQFAREQFKQKLLNEILVDLQICKIEGWNIKEYIEELKKEIDNIYNMFEEKINEPRRI